MCIYYNNYPSEKNAILAIRNEKRDETPFSTKGKSVHLLAGTHECPRERHSMSALWHRQMSMNA